MLININIMFTNHNQALFGNADSEKRRQDIYRPTPDTARNVSRQALLVSSKTAYITVPLLVGLKIMYCAIP